MEGPRASTVGPMQATVLSSTRWASPWLSKQHLAVSLGALGHDVLYVDPPVSPLSVLRQPERWVDLRGGTRPAATGVRVLTPRVLPGQDLRLIRPLNARLVAGGAARYQPAPDLVLAFGTEARDVLPRLPGMRAYHCTDSWEDHPANDARLARRAEDELIAGVDTVLACSLPLVEQLAARGVRARYLPHGCDVDSFATAEPAPDVAALPRPVVGYAGGINFRLDPRLLAAALESIGEGTLVVIGSGWRSARGGAGAAVRSVLRHPRVVSTGHRPPDELPGLLAALDVGIVPYESTPFNRKSFPLKVPQYLAAGLPVVSTPNGATDEYPSVVTVVDGPARFASAVRDVAVRPAEGASERRAAVAGRPWSVVASELLETALGRPRTA
jgi:teichuronic acid biosynthesis glycosyltransferase TuaH